jgi:hypothetical protein
MRASIPWATSVEDECRMMGRCPCGGDWRLAYNEVALRQRAWVDYIDVRCPMCDARAAFAFDVSRFFAPRPGVWGRSLASGRRKLTRLAKVRPSERLARRVRAVA